MGAAALLSTPAHAFATDNDGDDFHFDLIRSVGLTPFPTVAPNAHGKVKIESVGPVEIMKVKVWFVARFNIETFIVAPGVAPAPADPFHDPNRIPDATQNPATNPVQIYHLGLWFNNPQDVVKAGGPGSITPFNGEHDAGLQVLNSGKFGDTDGPLKRVTTSGN